MGSAVTSGRAVTLIALSLCFVWSAEEWAWAQEPGEQGDAHAVLERIAPITASIEQRRGLLADHEIAAGVHSRETLRAALIEQVDAEMSLEEFRVEEAVLRRLGILGADRGYRQLIVDLLTAQIAGFYDDDDKVLYLLDDLPLVTIEPTLAHELFHGIQDQRFSIGQLREGWERSDDTVLAVHALIEGDATAVMVDYALGGALSFTDVPNFVDLAREQLSSFDLSAPGMPAEIPPFILESLLFPYLGGLSFVHYLKSAGEWELVNQAYADLPLSTEQILHPERYVLRDAPTWVDVRAEALPLEGYEPVYDQVFGELQWRSLFRQHLSEEVAERSIDSAVAGWDGDRFLAFEHPSGNLILLALTVWDTPRDAFEFGELLKRALEARWEAELEELERGVHGALWALTVEGRWVVVERWGDMVLYLDGVPSVSNADAAVLWREAAWASRSRLGYSREAGDGED